MIHSYDVFQVAVLHACYWTFFLSSASTLVGVLTMFSHARKREEIYRFEIVATGIAGSIAILSLLLFVQVFAGMRL